MQAFFIKKPIPASSICNLEVNEGIHFEKDSLQKTMDGLDLVSDGEAEPIRSPEYLWGRSNARTLAKEPKSENENLLVSLKLDSHASAQYMRPHKNCVPLSLYGQGKGCKIPVRAGEGSSCSTHKTSCSFPIATQKDTLLH